MALVLNDVSVSYGRHRIIDGLNTRIAAGRVTGLIGPNGSGKSTLIRAIAGVHPHHGRIDLDGATGRELRHRTGYMPQDIPGNIALSALEAVIVASRRASSWRTSRSEADVAFSVLNDLGIGHLADRYLGECSGGQRQLISLAQTLVRTPELVLLDEPTSALDLRHQLRVLHRVNDYITAGNLTVTRPETDGTLARRPGVALIALHDLNLAARYCDDLLLLHHGKLIAHGPIRQVLKPDVLDSVYGINSRTIHNGERLMIVAEEREDPATP